MVAEERKETESGCVITWGVRGVFVYFLEQPAATVAQWIYRFIINNEAERPRRSVLFSYAHTCTSQ